VREIRIQSNGKAGGVVYFDADGQLQEQKAELVIIACNGVGTPRIMLNSKSKEFPDGIANRSGQMGKNLMFHPLS
jgi:choline dehydrogenase-like flavoprotein